MGTWSASRLTGDLLMLLGLSMVLPGGYGAAVADDATAPLFLAAALCAGAGTVLGGRIRWRRGRGGGQIRRGFFGSEGLGPLPGDNDGEERSGPFGANLPVPQALAAVSVGWVAVAVGGSLPFVLSGALSWVDALFEGVSAFTTTGATVLPSVSHMSAALLLWRSLLQWLGGMGIIVLFLSVFPRLGVSGLALFRAEIPGPAPTKALPRLSATSKLLWGIYTALTAAAFGALLLTGLPPYHALNHALAAVSTGGFTTMEAGPGAFSAGAQWVLLLFMFLGGTNFLLQYRLFRFGDVRAVLKDSEFVVYTVLQLGAGGLMAASLWLQHGQTLAAATRHGLFHAVSFVTTTGYAVQDYVSWPPLAQGVLFLLLFAGGSSGSTAGGPKVLRLLIAFKHAFNQLRQFLYPRSVTALRVGGAPVSERVLGLVVAFLTLYAATWFAGTLGLTALGMSIADAPSVAIAALGNIGVAFGLVGPGAVYTWLSAPIKLWLALLMMLGRLELLSILVLLHPAFWRGWPHRN